MHLLISEYIYIFSKVVIYPRKHLFNSETILISTNHFNLYKPFINS